MKIIILTQYFPPEIGAPQNRLYEVAVRLKRMGVDIEILTAMPNYPKMEIQEGYRSKWYVKEEMEGMTVHRAWIYVSQSKSIISRLLNYFSFVFTSIWIGMFKLSKADYLFCESPPLFLGISALFLKRIKRAKLIFNVADLWPETAEKLGIITNRFLLNSSTKLEEYLYRKSTLITGQTQGIVNNIKSRIPDKTFYWLPNGADFSFYDSLKVSTTWREDNGFLKDDFILLYGGIIGYAQGLDVILKAAERTKDNKSMKWVLLGIGPEKERLLTLKASMGLSNVFFFDAVTKARMPEIWKAVDVSIIPLRRLDIFKGGIPSKIFESMAMRKPVLLGVEGEAEDLFIKEGKAGLAYTPDDANDLALKGLELYNNRNMVTTFGENGYNYAKSKFNRDFIAQNFYNFLVSNSDVK